MIQLKDSYGKIRFIIVIRDGGEYEVCADHLQEALDFIIDHWEEQDTDNQSSHFLDLNDYSEEEQDEYISGGNAGRITSYTGFDIHVTSEVENPIYDFWVYVKPVLKHIEKLTSIINRSIHTITPPLDYDRLQDAFILLSNIVNDYEGDTESMWYLGEHEGSTLDDIFVGAYWHFTQWHAGQDSKSYAAMCALGLVFKPGMSSEEEENETFQALNALAGDL